jgi:hypothetical protein
LEEGIGSYRGFVRKLEGKSRIIRSKRRWENDIKIDLKELDQGRGVKKYDVAQDTDNLPPKNGRNFMTRKEI